jgi:predicted dehydrogenase
MSMKFHVGVIGATGYIATPYRAEMRAVADGFEIAALCARRPEPLAAAAVEDGCGFTTDDWRQVVDHPDVDLVMVTTPDRLHFDAVMAAAKAGKHIFCDKPVGADSKEAAIMWAACRDAGIAHYVPYWSRYMPLFQRAREIYQAGTLGELKGIMYRWHNPRPASMPFTWRDDASLSAAGSIADVGSHAYDAVRWIVGAEARRVLAHASVITPAKPDLGPVNLAEALDWGGTHAASSAEKTRQGTAFDYATIAWEFANGAVGALTLSHAPFFRKGITPELELHGTDASLALDRVRNTIAIGKPGQDLPEIETLVRGDLPNRFGSHVHPALSARVAGGGADQPGMEDAWRVQVFTDAAARSATRGEWVELAEVDAANGTL